METLNNDPPSDFNSPESKKEIWNTISQFVSNRVGTGAYDRWFSGAQILDISDTLVEIQVESDTHQLWIETNYMPELQDAVTEYFGDNHVASVIVDHTDSALVEEDLFQNATEVNEVKIAQKCQQSIDKKLKKACLNPLFTFEKFVVGQSNEFAHAASVAVSNNKGMSYSPLFIHGSPGMGKTHLMQAIGREQIDNDPEAKIVYLTCEKFTNEYIDAVKTGDLTKFRNRYRNVKTLLIDDIHFLAGKERSQEEFFHTFNELLALQSKIIITSDRPASEIKNLEPRLISRFESGLTVEIQQPQVETRMAILQKKQEDWDVKISSELVEFLATRIRTNIRRLEGGLLRLATFASLGKDSLSIEKAETLLKDILNEEGAKKVTIDRIKAIVAEQFEVEVSDIVGRRRPANIAFARQVAMYLSRKLTNSSLMEIGDAFGGRDHGTVIHACKKVEEKANSQEQVRYTVDLLDSQLVR
ncbi:chromosomal replication initiator protein DnaA [Akkermansiaceae bacterium]|nr:chromosomal replication initiator protein DnaA [Akkermansiaceae bacterium]